MDEKSKDYREGYEQGVTDLAEKVKKYYTCLSGKTMTAVVAYFIDQVAQELKEKHGNV